MQHGEDTDANSVEVWFEDEERLTDPVLSSQRHRSLKHEAPGPEKTLQGTITQDLWTKNPSHVLRNNHNVLIQSPGRKKMVQELLEAMHLIEIILLWSLKNPEKSLFYIDNK